jgi:hypothetical protein
MEGAMLKAILCNKSVSRVEIDQRARDARLRLEQIEKPDQVGGQICQPLGPAYPGSHREMAVQSKDPEVSASWSVGVDTKTLEALATPGFPIDTTGRLSRAFLRLLRHQGVHTAGRLSMSTL